MAHLIYCKYKISTIRFILTFETRIVGNSDESGCLNANSPSSTASSPTLAIPATLSTSSTSSTSNSSITLVPTSGYDDSHGPAGILIGGVIVGSIVALVAISTLGVFLYTRRKSKKNSPPALFSSGKRGGRGGNSVDLATAQSNAPHPPPMYPPREYFANPPVLSPQSGYGPQGQDEYSIVPYSPFTGASGGGHFNAAPSSYSGDESTLYPSSHYPGTTPLGSTQYSRSRGTSISSKAAMAGLPANGYGPTRFVLHTDAGVMNEVGEEVVELPPTYNDVSRGTIPSTPTTTTQNQTTTNSYSGDTLAIGAQLHPLAPSPTLTNQSSPSTPPVLPPLDHQVDESDSYDFGSELDLGSRSPPLSPRGTRHTQKQHEYPFASPSAQSGSNSRGPLSSR